MSKANAATARSKIGIVYAMGCTGFVADVLGKPQKHSSLWTRGAAVDKENFDLNNTHVTQSPAKPKENGEGSEE